MKAEFTSDDNGIHFEIKDEIQWLRMERQALRSSMLSAQERLAIDWAATIASQQSQVAIHKTLRRLLRRWQRWIPVSEGLPDDETELLVAWAGTDITVS